MAMNASNRCWLPLNSLLAMGRTLTSEDKRALLISRTIVDEQTLNHAGQGVQHMLQTGHALWVAIGRHVVQTVSMGDQGSRHQGPPFPFARNIPAKGSKRRVAVAGLVA